MTAPWDLSPTETADAVNDAQALLLAMARDDKLGIRVLIENAASSALVAVLAPYVLAHCVRVSAVTGQPLGDVIARWAANLRQRLDAGPADEPEHPGRDPTRP